MMKRKAGAIVLPIAGIGLILLVGCVSPRPGEMASPNLLVNGSMELWHSSGVRPQGWGLWTSFENYHRFQVFNELKQVRDGSTALGWRSDVFVNVYSSAEVAPGKTYTLSAYVRPDRDTTVLTKYTIMGAKEEIQRTWKLTANQWTRVHVTGVMPEGAERVTTYFCFQAGTYLFDQAMMNEGELQPYQPGPSYTPISPLGSPHGVRFTPRSYDAAGQVLEDQSVVFCFDEDVLSFDRLSNPTRNLPKRIGAEFASPVTLRGLCLLLDKPELPAGVSLEIYSLVNGLWEKIPCKQLSYGPGILLQTGLITIDRAIRLDFLPADGQTIPCPKIYHVQFMQ